MDTAVHAAQPGLYLIRRGCLTSIDAELQEKPQDRDRLDESMLMRYCDTNLLPFSWV